ncbi:O-antigen ligase family protein [Patescibacteria group bacterium]|nr:O-antigen ligase family protein [Patescibacteria group bacterium]
MRNISKKLFYLLILLLPINLGKHFEYSFSYVWGLLVDYLVPTIYTQDILVFLIIAFWLVEKGFPSRQELRKVFERKEFPALIFFIFSIFLSTLSAERFIPSIYFFGRTLLYIGLFLYVMFESTEETFSKILKMFGISVVFLGVLGIIQYIRQGAVFNDYLFFGEQPYSFSTWNIAKEKFLGVSKVASYGTFRHPNTFGGFLAIVLVWIFSNIKSKKEYIIPFVLGLVALVFTFSYTSWIVLVLGLLLYIIFSLGKPKLRRWVVSGVFIITSLLLFLPILGENFPFLTKYPSFYRRSNLLSATYKIADLNPLFGVGANNFTILVDRFMPKSPDLRFTQPVHNIFILIFTESGIFAFLSFVILLYLGTKKSLKLRFFVIPLVSLIQILLLGSLDHYLYTAHQTQLLFWIILGLSFI